MGKWLVDGVDLSTMATNVSNRSAGWHKPAHRGDNLEAPGRDGAVWAPNKPIGQGSLPLSMWALGAMPDGSMPTVKTRALICRENMERLFHLFSDSSRLHEVTRVESAGYGAVNLFRNPRSTRTLPGGIGYRNYVTNPALRSRGSGEAQRNVHLDPSLVQYFPGSTTFENLALDPWNKRHRTTGVPIPVDPTPHLLAPNTPKLYLELEHLPKGMNYGFMSGAGWDPLTGEWFQGQEVNNNALIHRYSPAGKYISTMTLLNAGHVNQMDVERTGNALRIWLMWEQVDEAGTVTSRTVRRIQYGTGTRTVDQAERITTGLGATTYAAPAIDQTNDLICLRLTTGGRDIFRVYRLSKMLQGVVEQLGQTIDMGSIDDTTYQGHAIYGESVYRITNIYHLGRESNTQEDWDNGTHVANNIDEYAWRTGTKVATKDYRTVPLLPTDSRKFRTEPEGLDVIVVGGRPVLIANWKVGSGDVGTYNEQRTRLMAITPTTPLASGTQPAPTPLADLETNYWGSTGYEPEHGFVEGSVPTTGWWVPPANVATMIGRPGNPTAGVQALELRATTALSAGSSLGRRGAALFPTGATPSFRCRVRRLTTITTARSIQMRAVWMDASGTIVGTSAWSPAASLPSGNSTWLDVQVTPAQLSACPTDRMSVEFRTVEAMAAGEGILIDRVILSAATGRTDVAAPFFDGDSPAGVWATTAGRSLAHVRGRRDTAWTATGTRNAFHAWVLSTPADQAGTAVNFVASAETPSGSQQFETPLDPGEVGKKYHLRLTARAPAGVTATVEVVRRRADNTVAGTTAVQVVGDGSITSWATTGGMSGTLRSYASAFVTRAEGETFTLRVTVPVSRDIRPQLQLHPFAFTDYGPGPRSGESVPSDDTTFDWAGAPYQSKTLIHRDGHPMASTPAYRTTSTPFRTLEYAAGGADPDGFSFTSLPISEKMRRAGLTAIVKAAGADFFASNQTTVQPQIRLRIAQLNDAGAEVTATTGSTTLLKLGHLVAANYTPVGCTIPATSIAAGATRFQVRVDLLNPAPTMTVSIGQPFFSDQVTAFTTPFFDGNTGGVWTGAPNNSESTLRVLGPAGYSVTAGTQKEHPTGSTDLRLMFTGTPTGATASVQIPARPAGLYRVGVKTMVQGDDTLCHVELWNGTSVVGTAVLGYLTAATQATTPSEYLQCVVTASAPFTAVRVRYQLTTQPARATTMWLGDTYLFSVAESGVPRISGNLVGNANRLVGVNGWFSDTAAPVRIVTTSFGSAFQRTASRFYQSRTTPVTAGRSYWMWARVQSRRTLQLRIEWRNAAGAMISRTTASQSVAEDQLRTMFGSVTAPAGAVSALVDVLQVGWVAGDVLNLYGIYLGEDPGSRDYGANLDPSPWLYFDGSQAADYQGAATKWEGAVDASTSITLPAYPAEWDNNGVTSLVAPLFRPPGSTGAVVAFPGFANAVRPQPGTSSGEFGGFSDGFTAPDEEEVTIPEQTLTGRTAAVQLTGLYLSGQVALARQSLDSRVTVRVYSCLDSARTSPQLEWEGRLAGLSGLVQWRDLRVSGWAYLEVEYFETAPNPGFAVVADNVLIVSSSSPLAEDYPGYFDGTYSSAAWQGAADNSASINYAGARRCFAEFPGAIDPTSMAGGTRAEFDVDGVIPSGTWEDVAVSTTIGTTSDPEEDFPLTDFTGTTYRITDTLITIECTQGTGPASFRLEDVRTGSWIDVDSGVPRGTVITVDCARFVVTEKVGTTTRSLGGKVSRGGSAPLLPLTPFGIDSPPVLRWSTTEPYDGVVQVTVRGRRKYVIA